MTHEEVMTLDRIVGRLEEAVKTLKERSAVQVAECLRHWEITNNLVRTVAAANDVRNLLASDAKIAREAVATEATERRQQRHWAIERFFQALPVLWVAASALMGYLIAKQP